MFVGDLNLNLLIKESIPALLLNMGTDCEEARVVEVEEAELHDVEEGEISDSASVEKTSEEAFNTPLSSPPPAAKSAANSNSDSTCGGGAARVWTMRDLQKYQSASKISYSGLYNLAWAQAINNKPLGEVFVMMEEEFRFLKRLVLVHGCYSYNRTAFLSQYSFYKSLLICFIQIFSSFISGISGTSLFNSISLMAYNVFYTSVLVLVSILDKDLSERTVMQHPQILFYCQAGRLLKVIKAVENRSPCF